MLGARREKLASQVATSHNDLRHARWARYAPRGLNRDQAGRAAHTTLTGKGITMAGQSAFGVIGLEVMGRNIAQNIERNGFPVAVFNRTYQKTVDFMEGPARGKHFKSAKDLKEFASLIDRPRRILMLVKAGYATDATIDAIK